MTGQPDIHIDPFGGFGFLVRLTTNDTVKTALRANAIADHLRRDERISDAVAGIDSVAVRFLHSLTDVGKLKTDLYSLIENTPEAPIQETQKTITIPVLYGGADGPDLEPLSKTHHCTPEALITRHTHRPFTVLTLGFAPGFAYMGPVDDSLAAPRLDTPRTSVPAGSVAVGGRYTSVYPVTSPGGWHLIGRTPKRLFNPQADEPFLFTPGNQVQFRAISRDEFDAYEEPTR